MGNQSYSGERDDSAWKDEEMRIKRLMKQEQELGPRKNKDFASWRHLG